MKSLFIVSSAILSGEGNKQERLLQTLHTIDSIKVRVPSADIWLCEVSTEPLPPWMIKLLEGVKIIEFYKDPRISQIREEVNHIWVQGDEYRFGQIKNRTESYLVIKALELVNAKDYDRIFKISGRYFLTNLFSIEDHSKKGTISLKAKRESKLKAETGIDYYRYCVMWSICSTIIEEIKDTFRNIEEYILEAPDKKMLADIEHGLHRFVRNNIIHDIPRTGAVGRVGGSTIIHAD